MKTLILYASKYGCAKDCAAYLKSRLNQETELMNLKKAGKIELESYDCVVIGGSIYIGKIQKEVRQFCEQNLQSLLQKKVALFICCTTPEQVDEFFGNNFQAPLLEHATERVNWGGELRHDKMSFFDKKITNMVSKLEPKKTEVLYKNIDLLAERLLASS